MRKNVALLRMTLHCCVARKLPGPTAANQRQTRCGCGAVISGIMH